MEESQLKNFLSILFRIDGFSSFMLEYKSNIKDGFDFLDSFVEWRTKKQPLSSDENLIITIVREKINDFNKTIIPPILFFDSTQRMDESIVSAFSKDLNSAKTGRKAIVDAKYQRYKTITESFIYDEVEDKGLIEKYADAEHPLVYAEISQSVINSGAYTVGLHFLFKNIKFINSCPNVYWNSPFGLFGCWQSLWEFGRLLGSDIQNLPNQTLSKYYKLLFLLMSRAIVVGTALKMAQVCDIFRNRAEMLRLHRIPFMSIFMDKGFIASNMDVQFISDCYRGYMYSCELGIGDLFQQMLWDSKKMYEYGSLTQIGNYDNGYKEIEDATWMKLVERGRIRSIEVSSSLCTDYENGLLQFSSDEWELICSKIASKHYDHCRKYDWKDFK